MKSQSLKSSLLSWSLPFIFILRFPFLWKILKSWKHLFIYSQSHPLTSMFPSIIHCADFLWIDLDVCLPSTMHSSKCMCSMLFAHLFTNQIYLQSFVILIWSLHMLPSSLFTFFIPSIVILESLILMRKILLLWLWFCRVCTTLHCIPNPTWISITITMCTLDCNIHW